jgi:YARHG domain
MKNYLLITTFILLFSCNNDDSNKTGTPESTLTPEKTTQNTLTNYEGVYHFGYSEMESSLIIIEDNGNYYAQIRAGEFNDDATDFIWNYENLTNVRIEENNFYSDKTNGEFITTEDGTIGLQVEKPWSSYPLEDDGSEIGEMSYSVDEHYSGSFTEASLRTLVEDDIEGLNKSSLTTMRNEIFARYGYIFKANGRMDTYFNFQDWYQKQHENVDQFLTDIEKINIATIKSKENELKDIGNWVSLEDFPNEWHALKKIEDNSYIVFIPCLASNKGFSLGQDKNNNTYLDVALPFDTKRYKVFDFTFFGIDEQEIYYGTFKLEGYTENEITFCRFIWNKENKYAEFEGLYENTIRMVNDNNKESYLTKNEECDEDDVY